MSVFQIQWTINIIYKRLPGCNRSELFVSITTSICRVYHKSKCLDTVNRNPVYVLRLQINECLAVVEQNPVFTVIQVHSGSVVRLGWITYRYHRTDSKYPTMCVLHVNTTVSTSIMNIECGLIDSAKHYM